MPEQPAFPQRRRCITIIAGAASAALVGVGRTQASDTYEWRGTALGADARLVFADQDGASGPAAVAAALGEIERLEKIFSLYRADSALSRLNRTAKLDPAPLELRDLLRRSLWFSRVTGGAFDVTVQSLWRAYADHYLAHPGDPAGPPQELLAAARAHIGADKVRLTATGIELAPGTQLSFNGIAQGYITDRVAGLFRDLGWRNVLIDLGEVRALDARAPGRPWQIALPDGGRTTLSAGALATSSPDGLRFTPGGAHHLFDPRTGYPADAPSPVTVAAPNATDADALSTALSVLNRNRRPSVIAHVPGARMV